VAFFFRRRKDNKESESANVPLERIDGNTHGSHMGAAYPDLERIMEFIRENLGIENLVAFSEQPFADGGRRSVAGHRLDLNDDVSLVVVLAEMNGSYGLATAYPVLWSGTRTELRINRILEWPIQIEATVEGKIGDAVLNFFPVDFFYLRDKYLQGNVRKLSLGFFAYSQSTNIFRDEVIMVDNADLPF
jgi:hypothetical protein